MRLISLRAPARHGSCRASKVNRIATGRALTAWRHVATNHPSPARQDWFNRLPRRPEKLTEFLPRKPGRVPACLSGNTSASGRCVPMPPRPVSLSGREITRTIEIGNQLGAVSDAFHLFLRLRA